MDVTTITVTDFKSQFWRDFPYLSSITYDPAQLYNCGNSVYYPTTLLFYEALIDGLTGVAPNTVTDPPSWKKIPNLTANYIQDQDITNAFAEAQTLFNPALFGSDANQKLAYLYLTAHFLCNDMRAASQGIAAAAQFPVAGRTVGSVSETYEVPEAYQKNPNYAFFTTSAYGMKFLQMALPNLIGNTMALTADANP